MTRKLAIVAALLAALVTAAGSAQAAEPFIPNDGGASSKPGGWAELQWNFTGSFGVDAPGAWANLIAAGRPGGQGVVVAVIDTGVAYADRPPYRRSPDFDPGTFVAGYDFVDDDPYPFDLNGHGTHVASTIAEQTDNGYGLTGLAYGVRIMPVRVLDELGSGSADRIATGIRYAADHQAAVINLSLNFGPATTAAQVPQVIRAVNYAYKRGVLVVAASGNQGIGAVAYPASVDHVLSVGATTESGCLSRFSNFGTGLDVVAPGGGSDASLTDDKDCLPGRWGRPIYQTMFRGARFGESATAQDYSGTSMATAHVSAAAALVIASGVVGAKPSPLNVQRRLEQTARDLGQPGYDIRYGWGLVNAAAATAPTATSTAASIRMSAGSRLHPAE